MSMLRNLEAKLGEVLAASVNAFNPAVIVIGALAILVRRADDFYGHFLIDDDVWYEATVASATKAGPEKRSWRAPCQLYPDSLSGAPGG